MPEPLSIAALSAEAKAALEALAAYKEVASEVTHGTAKTLHVTKAVESGEVESALAALALVNFKEGQELIKNALEESGLLRTETTYATASEVVENAAEDTIERLTRLADLVEKEGIAEASITLATEARDAVANSWEGARDGISELYKSEEFVAAKKWCEKWGEEWESGGFEAVAEEVGKDYEEISSAAEKQFSETKEFVLEFPGVAARLIADSPEMIGEQAKECSRFIQDCPEKFENVLETIKLRWAEGEGLLDKLTEAEQGFHEGLDEQFEIILMAKKAEYFVSFGGIEIPIDSSYENGFATKLPFVGSVNEVLAKYGLEEEITAADLAWAGFDVAAIIPLAWGVKATAQATKTATQATTELAEGVAKGGMKSSASAESLSPALGKFSNQSLKNWRDVRIPETDANLFPTMIDRFKHPMIRETPADYARDLYARNPEFRSYVNKWAEKLKEAQGKGPVAIDVVNTQLKRNLSDQLGSHMVEDAINPFFKSVSREVSSPLETSVTGIRTTRADLVFGEAKAPFYWKGHRIEKGSDFPIEVKTGQVPYLKGQAEHLMDQTAGHAQLGEAGMVITTRNFPQDPFTETMRNSLEHSSIHRLLPDKDLLDSASRSLVEEVAKAI